MRRFVLGLIGVLAVATPVAAAITITVSGNWSEIVDKNDLVAGAGTDLQATHNSVSNQIVIDISGTTGASDNWRVDIRRSDTSWHGDFTLYAQRTSAGTGGSVSGGTSYQAVTTVDATFFSGSDDVTGIDVQLRLTGSSLQVDPASYSTTVYYTVVDTI